MKRSIFMFWAILIFGFGRVSCQITDALGDFIFEDTLSFRPLYPWISIPSTNVNIWQFGQLQKNYLGNTLSDEHWIVTDTLNGYPVNIDNYFEILIPAMDSSWGEGILSFYHKYQTDSLSDGGFIEVSYDDGQTWKNIIFDSGHINTNFIGLYGQSDTISGNIPAFTGSIQEWSYVELYWFWTALVKKSAYENYGRPIIRFRFKSDSINTNKEGWLIDQLVFRGYAIMGSINDPDSERIDIFPNPFSDVVNISIPYNIISVIMKVYSMDGRLKFRKKIFSSESIDLSFLDRGAYVYDLYIENTRIKSGIIINE
jgi:hypothetical protein